ncbi:hypothetical protein A3A55_03430 [Candidatus Roizmanbacteria bacterium RIFCSPLOWO2_01_FULL_40_14]|uniref:DUF5671 domain-containing protein n=2 Tax=Candidatus Roizmaniibacteriota TaxID=1752723 RepID=A0A0G0VL87_9BACT|nr:MAG: hypothetical protein UU14_C0003G0018 [Candidatus Roizmanbacteria bacterium GW2011_GWB1_40_7]KKR91619.1 MAG: hypothetical protein UU41_C0034G0003 [Candidatus Roizmanbacteria bacterium GW2011_GWA1_41_13]OGK49775.1 MAG: hypothetical protein A3A55_03430 [Candidatus Roizmanbacteria bacterium RIFCSPLOWO2_01_FULL_40_14]
MQRFSIRLLYLYLFSFVGLLITVIGLIRLVELGMKVYIFQGADQYSYYSAPVSKEPGTENFSPEELKQREEEQKKQQEEENTRNRQREFSGAISMILVGIPLYLYHWKTIQKENKV